MRFGRFINPATFTHYNALVAWAFIAIGLEAIAHFAYVGLLPVFPGNAPIIIIILAGVFLFGEGRLPMPWWGMVGATALAVLAIAMHVTTFPILVGTFINAAIEELIYRLAIPVVIFFVLARHVGNQTSIWIGLATSTTLFALVHPPDTYVTSVLLSMLWFVMVWRGRSIWAAIFAHALLNVMILAFQADAIPPIQYSVLIMVLLGVTVSSMHFAEEET